MGSQLASHSVIPVVIPWCAPGVGALDFFEFDKYIILDIEKLQLIPGAKMLNTKMKKAGLKSARQFHFLQKLVESQKYQTSQNFLFLSVSDLELLSKVSVQTSIKYLTVYEKLGYIRFQPLRPANNKKINQYAVEVLQSGQLLIEHELKRSQKIKLYNKRRRQDDADFEF